MLHQEDTHNNPLTLLTRPPILRFNHLLHLIRVSLDRLRTVHHGQVSLLDLEHNNNSKVIQEIHGVPALDRQHH